MTENHFIFISYSSKDKNVADALCHYLEEHNIPCWIAPRDILPGQTWAGSIVQAISNCSAMVLIYTAESNASHQVANEVDKAFSYGKTIIPFIVDSTPMNDDLGYYLSRKHWLIAYPNYKENFKPLVDSLIRLIPDLPNHTSNKESPTASILEEKTSDEGEPPIFRPKFTECFQFEKLQQKQTEEGISIFVYLRVLQTINETYELKIQTIWGTQGEEINPFNSRTGKEEKYEFHFRKCPKGELGNIWVFGDNQLLSEEQAIGGNRIEVNVNNVTFNMVRVEGGTFDMGATPEQKSPYDHEKPVHQVTLSSYYIGETEVTQALWQAVMGSNPSDFKGDNLPVEYVSWDDCQTFIERLNTITQRNFRLPTEAEWEFAARGGNKSRHTQYSGSDNLDEVAWYNSNSKGKTHPVKSKKANELGIYDMSGNVWEWCQDKYGKYDRTPQNNPIGPSSGSYRMYRGGSWGDYAGSCRLSFRYYDSPDGCDGYLGLRLVLSE